jgi:homogentisate 1,2-dioxygenase
MYRRLLIPLERIYILRFVGGDQEPLDVVQWHKGKIALPSNAKEFRTVEPQIGRHRGETLL